MEASSAQDKGHFKMDCNSARVHKNFEFLVHLRQGHAVLNVDNAGDRTVYFCASFSCKLQLQDNESFHDYSAYAGIPAITNFGTKFYVEDRHGCCRVSLDNQEEVVFSFQRYFSFSLVFTDKVCSIVKHVNEIPKVSDEDLKSPPQLARNEIKPYDLLRSISSLGSESLVNDVTDRMNPVFEHPVKEEVDDGDYTPIFDTVYSQVQNYHSDIEDYSENHSIKDEFEDIDYERPSKRRPKKRKRYIESEDEDFYIKKASASRDHGFKAKKKTKTTLKGNTVHKTNIKKKLNGRKGCYRKPGQRKKKEDADYRPDSADEGEEDDYIDPQDDVIYKHNLKKPEENGEHPCDECGKVFETNVRLKKHKKKYHAVTYPCDECGKVFETNVRLKKHKKKYHAVTYPCDECDEVLKTAFQLKKHKRDAHLNAKKFLCDLCDQEFKNKSSLKNHFKVTHFAPFQCEACSITFESIASFKKHQTEIHNITHVKETMSYLCDSCGKSYKDKKNHSCTRFKCKLCGETGLITSKHLQRHLKAKHMKDISKFGNKVVKQCFECDMVFLCSHALRRHQRSHSTDCSKCGEIFPSRISLHKHLRTHEDFKKYVCLECGTALCSLKSLETHKKKQHNIARERKFKCADCGLGFYNFCTIERHMLSHTQERSFLCEMCPKSFSLAYNLKVHMRSHTKEKNFVCQVCGAAFGYRCSLRAHVTSKHKEWKEYFLSMDIGISKEIVYDALPNLDVNENAHFITVTNPMNNVIKYPLDSATTPIFKSGANAPVTNDSYMFSMDYVERSAISTVVNPVLGVNNGFMKH